MTGDWWSQMARVVTSKVRGQTRHTWDMNFKVRWSEAWGWARMGFPQVVVSCCSLVFLRSPCFTAFRHVSSSVCVSVWNVLGFDMIWRCRASVFSRTYQWMGSNFEEGPQRAEGQMAVCDFSDATTLRTEKTPPFPGRKKTCSGLRICFHGRNIGSTTYRKSLCWVEN